MIELNNISKVFKSKHSIVNALENVSISIDDGDIYGIIGFSGAGKSTLLRMINALEVPTQGNVYIDNKDINKLSKNDLRNLRKSIGMIFQQFNLLESKTVYENIALPLKLNKVSTDKIESRVKELLEFVELSDKKDVYPKKLSGGQKQRVGIARALATNPKILLCDEATSALDPKTTDSILKLLQKINKQLNITIVIITHEMNVIEQICNKVAVMEYGKVVETGTVLDVFGNPQHNITKNFVKTVINDSIPQILIEGIRKDTRNYELLRLKFLDGSSTDSVLSMVNKKYDVETNILFANISQLEQKVLGIIIVDMIGSQEEIVKAKQYIIDSNVEISKLNIA